MLTLYIRNITGLADISDYEWVTMVNAEKIAEGIVRGHVRADGWAQLVKRIAISHEGENDGQE